LKAIQKIQVEGIGLFPDQPFYPAGPHFLRHSPRQQRCAISLVECAHVLALRQHVSLHRGVECITIRTRCELKL
jgi:hypothetical protein